MGRLIDVDTCLAKAKHEAEAMPEEQGNTFLVLTEWLIGKTPTAYDVDKVVDNLRGYAKYKGILRPSMSAPAENYVPISAVIDIVKRGGVDG